MRGITFNGKFLVAKQTGVHRVAQELIQQIDGLLIHSQTNDQPWSLISPRNAIRSLPLRAINCRTAGRTNLQIWEQFELPALVGGDLLVNLCNLAPISNRCSVTMIHDAQVFISPESYPPAFVAWYRFALPRIGASASRILTVSDFSRKQLVKFGVAPLEKIEVIYNGVDHLETISSDSTCASRLGLKPGAYVLALANTQKHKNIRILLEAFAKSGMTDLTLALVGAADAKAFSNLGLAIGSNVKFCGRVSDSELRGLYEQALCLAFPSTTEGFGLPPLEAMMAGCPVVVAPCGALPEVCGTAALYADPDDSRAWAEAILSLASDQPKREAYIKGGKIQAAQFTWHHSGKQLMDLLVTVSKEWE